MSWSENDDDESYVHVNGIRNVMVCPSNISVVNSQPDPSIYCSTRVIPITTPMNINKGKKLSEKKKLLRFFVWYASFLLFFRSTAQSEYSFRVGNLDSRF